MKTAVLAGQGQLVRAALPMAWGGKRKPAMMPDCPEAVAPLSTAEAALPFLIWVGVSLLLLPDLSPKKSRLGESMETLSRSTPYLVLSDKSLGQQRAS